MNTILPCQKNIDAYKAANDKPTNLYKIHNFYFDIEIVESKNAFYVAGMKIDKSLMQYDLYSPQLALKSSFRKNLINNDLSDDFKRLQIFMSRAYEISATSDEVLSEVGMKLKPPSAQLMAAINVANFSYSSLLDEAIPSARLIQSYSKDQEATLSM